MVGSWVVLQSGGTVPWVVAGALVLAVLAAVVVFWRRTGENTLECPECGHERETRGGRGPNCGTESSPGEGY